MRSALLVVMVLWAALARSEDKLPVLIVDGINNHDWQTATRELQALLLESGRFTVDVSTSPPADAPAAAWNAWNPDFARYRVIVNNFNGGETHAAGRPAAPAGGCSGGGVERLESGLRPVSRDRQHLQRRADSRRDSLAPAGRAGSRRIRQRGRRPGGLPRREQCVSRLARV